MPIQLKLSNAAANPAKWDTGFKTKLAEAGDASFFTQLIFAKWWKNGLEDVFLPPLGAELVLTIDGAAKKFSWLIKPKDAKACVAFLAKNPTLKAVMTHTGAASGFPKSDPAKPEAPAAKKEAVAEEEDPEKKIETLYHPLFEILDKHLKEADAPAKVILEDVRKKVQEAKAKKVMDIKPMVTLLTQTVEKVKKEMETRRKDPATNVTPPSAEELAKQRAADEIKFRKSQSEMQKAAATRKAEAAAAAAPPAEEEDEDADRWVPTVGDLPLYGSLNDAQKAYVRAKLDDFNSRGKGGGAHKGVGGVVTLDMTGPAWGTSGRGAWRLQIMTGSKTLNIVDHAGKTWK